MWSFLWHPERVHVKMCREHPEQRLAVLYAKKAKRGFVAEQGMLDCSRAEEAMTCCLSKSKVYWVDIWIQAAQVIPLDAVQSERLLQCGVHSTPACEPYSLCGQWAWTEMHCNGKHSGLFLSSPSHWGGNGPLGLSVLSMYLITELHPGQFTGF